MKPFVYDNQTAIVSAGSDGSVRLCIVATAGSPKECSLGTFELCRFESVTRQHALGNPPIIMIDCRLQSMLDSDSVQKTSDSLPSPSLAVHAIDTTTVAELEQELFLYGGALGVLRVHFLG